MIWIVIILGMAILLVSSCLLLLYRELICITRDLSKMEDLNSNRRLRTKTGNRVVIGLAAEINRQMDLHRSSKLLTDRLELELRDAITGISHDLRTPLTSILGYLQLIQKTEPDTDRREEYVKIAEGHAKSLQQLINDLFELSAVSSRDYEVSLEPVNLNKILLEVLVSFYDRFSERELVPEFSIPDEAVMVSANVQAVKRVLENLVSNALAHSRGGMAASLTVRGKTALITITNPAEHVNPEQIERMFTRFYSTDKTDGDHKGFGLAIAKELMGKMGGTIAANVQDGRLCLYCEWKLLK